MGLLVDGEMTNDDPGPGGPPMQTFTDFIKADGSTRFAPEKGRYILYVSTGCPYAARPYMLIHLLGMQDVIEVVRTFPGNGDDSWFFKPQDDFETFAVEQQKDNAGIVYDSVEPTHGFTHVHQLYTHTDPTFSGRVTVPVLFDQKHDCVVNNESFLISEMLIKEFAAFHDLSSGVTFDFTDNEETAALSEWMHDRINTGVYKAHFSPTQKVFSTMSERVYSALDEMEARLTNQPFLMGDNPHFLDMQLFATLVRYDPAYYHKFRLTKKTIYSGYPALWQYVLRVHALPGIAETVEIEGIKTTYYYSRPLSAKGGLTVPPTPEGFQLPASL